MKLLTILRKYCVPVSHYELFLKSKFCIIFILKIQIIDKEFTRNILILLLKSSQSYAICFLFLFWGSISLCMEPWLSWSFLCRPGWTQAHRYLAASASRVQNESTSTPAATCDGNRKLQVTDKFTLTMNFVSPFDRVSVMKWTFCNCSTTRCNSFGCMITVKK